MTAHEEAVAALRDVEKIRHVWALAEAEGLPKELGPNMAARLCDYIDSLAAALTQAQQELDDLAEIAAAGNEREKTLEAQVQQVEEAARRALRNGARMPHSDPPIVPDELDELRSLLSPVPQAGRRNTYDEHVTEVIATHGTHSDTSCPPHTRQMCSYRPVPPRERVREPTGAHEEAVAKLREAWEWMADAAAGAPQTRTWSEAEANEQKFLAALDSLAAALAQAQQERSHYKFHFDQQEQRAEKAEARAQQVEEAARRAAMYVDDALKNTKVGNPARQRLERALRALSPVPQAGETP